MLAFFAGLWHNEGESKEAAKKVGGVPMDSGLPKKGAEKMDITKMISTAVDKIKKDPSFASKFKSDPVKALEQLLGIDLPDEQIKALIDGIQANISLDKVSSLLDSDGDGKPDLGILNNLGSLGSLFGKK